MVVVYAEAWAGYLEANGREMGLEQTVAMARKWGNEQNIIPAPVDIDFVHEMK